MSNRKRLARERLEIYLVHFILAYRFLFVTIGIFLLAYALFAMIRYLLIGVAILLPVIYLLLLSSSFIVVVFTARLAAWLGTLRMKDD